MVRQALSFERFLRCDPVDEVIALASSFTPPPWAGRGAAGARGQRFASSSDRWSVACKTWRVGAWHTRRRARGMGRRTIEGLLHVASYRESHAGRDRPPRQAGWPIPRRRLAPPGTSSGTSRRSRYLLDRDGNLLSTLIARGLLEEANQLAGDWDLSAPFSVVPMAPPLLHIRGTLRLARGGARERRRGPDRGRRGPRGDAHVQPGGDSLAPGGRAGARRARPHRRGPADRRRGRAPGTLVRRGHVIGTMLRARSSIEPRRRALQPCGSRSPRSSASGPPHELARSQLELGAALRRGGQRSDVTRPLREALELAHVLRRRRARRAGPVMSWRRQGPARAVSFAPASTH